MDAARNRSPWMRHGVIGFAFVAPFLTLYFVRSHLLLALAPLFLSHVLFLYATLVPNCQWLGPVVRSFTTTEPEIWLTIDDGPSPVHTSAVLDLLDRFEARATFFVIGQKAEKHPHLVTEILARGHEVANHTYTHPSGSFWAAGPVRTFREIDRCGEHLRAGRDRPARYFRSPVGLKNFFLHPELERRGLVLVGWSTRGLDTVRRDAARIAATIVRRVRPGAIIVLHEGHRLESDPEFNPRCLEATLTKLAEQGYRCVIPRPEQLREQRAGK